MASLRYLDEDGNRKTISGLEKVRDGALVGAPDLDSDDVVGEIEAANKQAEKAATAESDVDPDDWPLVTTPEDYLKKTPKGPQAKLAQQMVDAGHGDVSATADDDEED